MTTKVEGTLGIEFPDGTTQSTASGFNPIKTRFFAVKTTNTTGQGRPAKVTFDSVVWQTGTGYNSTTGIFTAPTNGYYLFCAACEATGTGLVAPVLVGYKNKGGVQEATVGQQAAAVSTTSAKSAAISTVMKLNTGDTLEIDLSADGGTSITHVGNPQGTWFSGHILSTF